MHQPPYRAWEISSTSTSVTSRLSLRVSRAECRALTTAAASLFPLPQETRGWSGTQIPISNMYHQVGFAHGSEVFILSGAAKAMAIRKPTTWMLFMLWFLNEIVSCRWSPEQLIARQVILLSDGVASVMLHWGALLSLG